MRDIRFRAWDKENKKMYVGDFRNEGKHIVIMLNGEIRIQTGLGASYEPEFLHKTIILMQYTGLKDKNGKEVWESDIVKKHDTIKEYNGSLGVIEYEPLWIRFKIKVIKGNEWSFEGPDGPNWFFEDIEVIGNIYENKTLLSK